MSIYIHLYVIRGTKKGWDILTFEDRMEAARGFNDQLRIPSSVLCGMDGYRQKYVKRNLNNF